MFGCNVSIGQRHDDGLDVQAVTITMKYSYEQLKQLLPGANETIWRLNAGREIGDISFGGSGPVAVVECDSGNGALEPQKVQRRIGRKIYVRVTAFRIRLLDDDNCCEKYHVDLLRYAGIILGDGPKEAKIEVFQEKVSSEELERVVLEVFEI